MMHTANELNHCWPIVVVGVKEDDGRDRGQRLMTHYCHP